jgi:hypothetical protein
MSTTKSRINISLPADVKAALLKLAEIDNVPVDTKAESLLEIALELEEDQMWDKIATERDSKKSKFLTHAEVFGE